MSGELSSVSGELSSLGADLPLWAAPMAGGPSTPALVLAAARAGGVGFLAGGYKSAPELAAQIAEVRGGGPFGVNLFVPEPVPVDRERYREYARTLQKDADRYGLTLRAEPLEDDDGWTGKIELLLNTPVPLVSFTFGLPDAGTVRALQDAGTLVAQTVTTPGEALAAAEAGADVLIVQATAAGGHSATLTPGRERPATALPELVGDVRRATRLPVVATGGIGTAADTAAALRAGARAAMVGTVLLRTEESGASAAHRAALADPAFDRTVVTRAFTGRPARSLRNEFTDSYGPVAPPGYPALHHLTSPLRKAATAAGDTARIHLWAGTAYREARREPAADTFARLTADL